MKAVLPRTGSILVQKVNRCGSGSTSPRLCRVISFGSEKGFTGIRRSISDSNMVRSESGCRFSRTGSASFQDLRAIVEEEIELDFTRDWPGNVTGIGKGNGNGSNGGGNDGKDERNKIGEYYLEMLKQNPGDSLLLTNYAKYLHEVERNKEKAKEYYGRAILASPGDGEILSMYAKLIWESEKDEERANSYFDQALHASPHDCMVLGSYANFLWEVDDDEEITNLPMVGAY